MIVDVELVGFTVVLLVRSDYHAVVPSTKFPVGR